MATAEIEVPREALPTLEQANDDISRPIYGPSWRYYLLLAICGVGILAGGTAWAIQIKNGIGMAGINNPVSWGVYIVTFVFWVGIAHSGTLISAVLYLVRSGWRTTINRAAEAMTIFAVMTAGLFPLIHLGRVWYFYYLVPYPSTRLLWPNFRSPLVWDMFAIGTYFTISLVFWYIGLIPDLAILRDKFTGVKKKLYGTFALGWQGSVKDWSHYRRLYLYLAGIATPLVLSVHSVVSWDFAMGVVPGWHSTIFAPYFVAGAIFSGIAMVITIMIPMRWAFGLEKYITRYHFAWRANGYYAGPFWIMVFCNVVVPMSLWFKRTRNSLAALFAVTIFVNIGMWYERFVIIVTSLAHEFEPGGWGIYVPTTTEILIMIGSFAWFFFWFLLFSRTLPVISIAEVKEHLAHEHEHGH